MQKLKLELSIPSDLKDEPIIYLICTKFKVIPNIIEASFSTTMGWVVLTVEGEKDEVNRLIAFLTKKNILVKSL